MPVRDIAEPDFPAICAIYLDAKRDELRFEPGAIDVIPLAQDAVVMAAFQESRVLVFEDREVLGFAALHDHQLRALFVRRDARGAGVGQALLDAALAAHAGRLMLNVAYSNQAAQRFYRRNGFDVVGETERNYGGTTVAYLRMTSDGS